MRRKLILAATLAALLCACATKWETVNEDGFTVQMPGTPTHQTQSVDTASGKIDITLLSVEKSGEAFIVGYNDIPAAVAAMADQNPDSFLNNARDGAVRNVNGKVTSERPVTIDGHPGKEFIGDSTSPQEATFTARVYWVNPHLYQQLYIRPKAGSATSENGQKFLDSFKLTGGK